MKPLRYEIRWESATGEGRCFVTARSDEEAIRLFREEWGQYGDEPPTCWVVGRWSVRS